MDAQFESDSASFFGHTSIQASAGALLLHPELSPAGGAVHINVPAGEVLVLQTDWVRVQRHGEPTFYQNSGSEQLRYVEPVSGSMRVAVDAASHVRVLPEALEHPLSLVIQGQQMEARRAPDLEEFDRRGRWHGEFDRPAWPVQAASLLTGVEDIANLTQPHAILIHAATVHLPSGEVLEAGVERIVTTPGPDRVEVDRVTHVIIKAASSGILWGAPPAVLVHEAQVDHEGQARFVKADGAMRLGNESFGRERQLLIVNGSLEASLEVSGRSMAWSIGGTVDRVEVDGKTVLGAPWVLSMVAASAVAVIVGAALAILQRLPGLLGRVEDPLANEKRAAIMQTLTEEPGQSIMQLAERHHLSRNAVRHHLAKLQSFDLISEHREGKIPRYMLNSGSSRFLQEGVSAAQAFAAMAHPVRKAIIEAAAEGPVNYSRLGEVHPTLTERTFRKHCQVLRQAALLESVHEGQSRCWVLVADPHELKAHYIRSYSIRNR